MNSVVLIGRLTKDPVLKYTAQSQMAVATFTLAIDRVVREGEQKKTDYPRVTVFGKQAESCEKFLKKGRLAGVQGKLQTGSYQNKDGQTVYTTDVVADRVEFLEWGDAKENTVPEVKEEHAPVKEEYTPEKFEELEEDIPF